MRSRWARPPFNVWTVRPYADLPENVRASAGRSGRSRCLHARRLRRAGQQRRPRAGLTLHVPVSDLPAPMCPGRCRGPGHTKGSPLEGPATIRTTATPTSWRLQSLGSSPRPSSPCMPAAYATAAVYSALPSRWRQCAASSRVQPGVSRARGVGTGRVQKDGSGAQRRLV